MDACSAPDAPILLKRLLARWRMSSSASRNDVAPTKPIFTLVPDHDPIALIAYYPEFIDYYRECKLQTKRWFVENMGADWVCFDVGANVGYYSILFSRLAKNGRSSIEPLI